MVEQEPKMLGDVLEEAAKIIGADKVAKAVERVTKKPCGCAKRKEALNAWHVAAAERRRKRAAARKRGPSRG